MNLSTGMNGQVIERQKERKQERERKKTSIPFLPPPLLHQKPKNANIINHPYPPKSSVKRSGAEGPAFLNSASQPSAISKADQTRPNQNGAD